MGFLLAVVAFLWLGPAVHAQSSLPQRSMDWQALAERIADRLHGDHRRRGEAMEWTPPSDGVISARKKRTCGAFDQRRRRPWTGLT